MCPSLQFNEVCKAYSNGTATEEQKAFYKDNLMDRFEKAIGVPLFEMNSNQKLDYECRTENARTGCLDEYDCKICRNKGYIVYPKDGYKVIRDCKCMAIRCFYQECRGTGLGNLLNVYKLDRYIASEPWQKKVLETAKAYRGDGNKWFVLLGQRGSGKSHICTGIVRRLLRAGHTVHYMPWLDENRTIKSLSMDDHSLLNRIKNCEVLYIDDFLKVENGGTPTSADLRNAMEIINYRYNKSRSSADMCITIISSEHPIKKIAEFDSAIAGRIVEMSELLELTGADKDYRLKGKL